MPQLHPCHPAPPPAPAGQPVTSLRGALGVVLLARRPDEPSTIVLLLDHQRRGLTCVCVGERAHAEAAGVVADFCVEVARATPALGAVVLASCRPGPAPWPDAADLAAFPDLRARLAAAGVALVDWLLVGSGFAVSVATEVGDDPWDT